MRMANNARDQVVLGLLHAAPGVEIRHIACTAARAERPP